MNKDEKNAILLSQNDRASQSLRQAYYINQARLEVDYEQWDLNELSWIFQQFYNAEATIAKLRVRLNEDHPLQQARELEDWLTYPTKILNKQIQLLVAAVQDMKTPLEDRTKSLKLDYHKQATDIFYNRKVDYHNRFAVGYPIPSLLGDALTTHEQSKALYVHMNAVVNASKRWLLEIAKKKGGLDYTDKTQFQEVVGVMRKHLITQASHIERIKPMYEMNRNRWAYARFEEWDSFIKQVRREYEFRKAIPMWKMLKSKIERALADFLDATEHSEKEMYANNIYDLFFAPTDATDIWENWNDPVYGGMKEEDGPADVMRPVSPPSDTPPNIYVSDILAFVRASGWIDDVDEVLAKVSRVADDNPLYSGFLVKPEFVKPVPFFPFKVDPNKLPDEYAGLAQSLRDNEYFNVGREEVFGPLIELGCLEENYTEYYKDTEVADA